MEPQSQPFVRPPQAGLPIANPIPDLAAAMALIIRRLAHDEPQLCRAVAAALAPVIRSAAWLGPALRRPRPDSYRRHCLHEAPDGAFSIGCFVWGPGQRTPIHDHRAWGVIGTAIGEIECTGFVAGPGGLLVASPPEFLAEGACAWIHPAGGDIHRVGAAGGTAALSIHVYGCRFDEVCRQRYAPDGTVLAS